MSQRVYTLTDFNTIENRYNIMEFNKNIINIINDLASKVGAPNYSKTPIFKKDKKIIQIGNLKKQN